MSSSSDAVWIRASSAQLEKFGARDVLRHPHGRPRGRRRVELLERAARSLYPDAVRHYYAGGVLRFRWNGGEGSGEAYNAPATPGPVTFR